MTTHPGRPDLPDWDFRSANFTYSNWNEPHTYVCAICDAQGLTRPPIGVLELSPFEDDGWGGEFIALCYTHMGIEVKKWTDHFDEKHRTEA